MSEIVKEEHRHDEKLYDGRPVERCPDYTQYHYDLSFPPTSSELFAHVGIVSICSLNGFESCLLTINRHDWYHKKNDGASICSRDDFIPSPR